MIAFSPDPVNSGVDAPPGPGDIAERRGLLVADLWCVAAGPCPDRELAARRDLESLDAELERLLDAHLAPHPQSSADGLSLIAVPTPRRTGGGA